ncbi:hypothetical protein GJ496_007979 [Pomphorhynchus laevis]|nr:hypothetical protein GJ496_007979 [Pomphorhynchus laevis]
MKNNLKNIIIKENYAIITVNNISRVKDQQKYVPKILRSFDLNSNDFKQKEQELRQKALKSHPQNKFLGIEEMEMELESKLKTSCPRTKHVIDSVRGSNISSTLDNSDDECASKKDAESSCYSELSPNKYILQLARKLSNRKTAAQTPSQQLKVTTTKNNDSCFVTDHTNNASTARSSRIVSVDSSKVNLTNGMRDFKNINKHHQSNGLQTSTLSEKPKLTDCSDKFSPNAILSYDDKFNEYLERAKPSKISNATYDSNSINEHLGLHDTCNFNNWQHRSVNELCDYLMDTHLYFKDGILALNKPYGLPTIGGPKVNLSISSALPLIAERLYKLKQTSFIHLIHRLDKDTSGVLLCAYDEVAEKKLRKWFNDRHILKQYIMICKGVPYHNTGELSINIKEHRLESGKYKMLPNKDGDSANSDAVTRYSVLGQCDGMSLISAQPVSGLKHQVRCHFGFGLQCPILGDHKYSHINEMKPQRLNPIVLKKLKIKQTKVRNLPLYLHAQSCVLRNFLPAPSGNLIFESPIPQHFLRMMKLLNLKLF